MPVDPAAVPDRTPSTDAAGAADAAGASDATGASDGGEAADRHVAARAELLPEELAVGSDDAAAQAEAILAESQERIDHPDADTSSQSRHASSEEAARRGDPEGGTA